MTLELSELQADRLKTTLKENGVKGKKPGSGNREDSPTVISKRDEIPLLDADTKFVHFSIRPTIKDIYELLDACPRLEKIQVPRYIFYAISDTTLETLKLKNIELIEGTIHELPKKSFLFRRQNN